MEADFDRIQRHREDRSDRLDRLEQEIRTTRHPEKGHDHE